MTRRWPSVLRPGLALKETQEIRCLGDLSIVRKDALTSEFFCFKVYLLVWPERALGLHSASEIYFSWMFFLSITVMKEQNDDPCPGQLIFLSVL